MMMHRAPSEPESEDRDKDRIKTKKEDEAEQQGIPKRTEKNNLKYIFLPERRLHI
jgi:hypothetical protein